MSIYNGRSANDTYQSDNSAYSHIVFVGDGRISGRPLPELILAVADQDMADLSTSAAHLSINVAAQALCDAWYGGPAKNPFDQVVG